MQIASGTIDSVITTNSSDYFLNLGKNTIRLSTFSHKLDKGDIVNAKGRAIKFKVKDFTRTNEKNNRKITCNSTDTELSTKETKVR